MVVLGVLLVVVGLGLFARMVFRATENQTKPSATAAAAIEEREGIADAERAANAGIEGVPTDEERPFDRTTASDEEHARHGKHAWTPTAEAVPLGTAPAPEHPAADHPAVRDKARPR